MRSTTIDAAPLQRVLSALTEAGCDPKQSGERHDARCPVHDDKNPSLSLSEGSDGRVLLRCHAGCRTDDIIAALGMKMSDLFVRDDGDRDRRPRIVETYQYRDEQGDVLFEVVRYEPKGFRQRRPDGSGDWIWKLGDMRRVPYRLPELIQAVAAGETIYLVEGEKDAEAMVRAGYCATCSPQGAGKWRDEFSQYLASASVVIVADADRAGYRHAYDVLVSLAGVAATVRVVQAAHGKDAADHLVAGLGVDDFEDLTAGDLERLCETATTPSDSLGLHLPRANEPQPVVSSWESVDLAPVLRGEIVSQPPTIFTREDGVKLFYPGRINAVFGETEGCKSWLVDQAAKEELDAGHHVIVIDFEDSPEALVERLRALGASSESIESHLTYIAPAGTFDELAVAIVSDKINERGHPTLVIGDGVTEAMSQVGLDPNVGPDVAKFYGSWPRAFARIGASVALVDHVTKSTEGRGRWAIGSERKLSGLDGAAYAVELLAEFGRGRTGKLLMTVSKDRCGYVRQHQGAKKVIALVELKSWPDGGVTVSVAPPESAGNGPFRPTHLMHKLSEAIQASPGLSKRALRAAVNGSNDGKDLALEMLIADDYVRVESGSNNSQKHFSIRPYISVEEVR